MKKSIRLLLLTALLSAAGLIAFKSIIYAGQPVALKQPSFLFLSDIHLDSRTTSCAYGEDTGMDLWKRFLAKADSVLSGADAPGFIIYTGDLPSHYSCDNTCYLPDSARKNHNEDLTAILTGLRKLADKSHKPLFYLPGNNDGLAGDYYSFADEKKRTPLSLVPSKTNPFPALNINPGTTKPPCLISAPHPTLGYYAARPVNGLRLLALNTVIYNHKFTPVDGSNQIQDGNTQMAWVAAQLAEAQAKGEKVYIAMHIPPGLDAWSNSHTMWAHLPNAQQSWQNTFLSLTNRYQKTIAGILYGHTHMDELRRLYDSTGTNITEVAICCPGVTPQHSNNPGFKTVQYDAASKELMDFTTYYTTPAGNGWGNNSYTFRQTFSAPPGLSIYQTLKAMSLNNVGNCVNNIYTVKNGPAGTNIQPAIEVMWGQ